MAGKEQTAVRSQATISRSVVQDGPVWIAWRLLVGFGGGYAFVSAMIAAIGSVLPLVGMPRGEAVSLALLLALLLYVPAILWMIATHKPLRDALALCGIAALLAMVATAV